MWTFIIILAVLFVLWALAIMPRVTDKPDFAPLEGWFYAHRGLYSKDQSVPENSLPGFALAVQRGFGVELDVHLTKDGKLAVLHDDDLQRMCGANGNLADLNSGELRNYKLAGTENTIPLFQDVLRVIDGKIPMIIELKVYKGNCTALCERLCKELGGYDGAYCIESFDPRAVLWFKKHRPSVVRGQLAMRPAGYGKAANPLAAFVAGNLLLNFLSRPDFIAYCVNDRRNVSFRLCKSLYGVQEFAWTVNDRKQGEEVQKNGGMLIFEHYNPK